MVIVVSFLWYTVVGDRERCTSLYKYHLKRNCDKVHLNRMLNRCDLAWIHQALDGYTVPIPYLCHRPFLRDRGQSLFIYCKQVRIQQPCRLWKSLCTREHSPIPFPNKKDRSSSSYQLQVHLDSPFAKNTVANKKKSINHGFPIIRRKSMITHHDTTSQLKPQHLLTRHRLLPSTTYLPPLQMMNCWNYTVCTSKQPLVTTPRKSQVFSTWRTVTSGMLGKNWRVLRKRKLSNSTSSLLMNWLPSILTKKRKWKMENENGVWPSYSLLVLSLLHFK